MAESRKSLTMTKSIRYLYDIEYVKHYNYYEDSSTNEDDYDENRNLAKMDGSDADDETAIYVSEEEDVAGDLPAFAFKRVSTTIYYYRTSLFRSSNRERFASEIAITKACSACIIKLWRRSI